VALGDDASAIRDYRAAIDTDYPTRNGATWGDGYQENNVTRLMEFAMVLSRARNRSARRQASPAGKQPSVASAVASVGPVRCRLTCQFKR
jgi:hypothetical protein